MAPGRRWRVALLMAVVLLLVILWELAPMGRLYISTLRSRTEEYSTQEAVAIHYGADLDTASHSSGLVFPLDIKLRQLDVLQETGVGIIRVTLAHDPFLGSDQEKIDDLDRLVAEIRKGGDSLMIADGAAEKYWESPMDWDRFSAAFLDRVRELAQRYRPEYYIVVKEPVWYTGMTWTRPGGMLTETVTVAQWLSLTEEVCRAVDQVSPDTRTGVAIALPYPESIEYLKGADKIEGLDFVGADVYSLEHLDVLDQMLAEIEKPHWILETWDGHPDRQRGQHWRERSSAEWIRMISSYAQSRGFDGMVTFYNLYLCYGYGRKPRSLDEVRKALDRRQESYQALESVAAAGG